MKVLIIGSAGFLGARPRYDFSEGLRKTTSVLEQQS